MYDTFSSDYDRFVHWPGRLAFEMPFLRRQLDGLSPASGTARILDAACGTGMHTIALAQAGFSAAGADLSAGMIERARDNARSAGAEVDFRVAGFGEISRFFMEPFDALLCLGNSLPHLLNPEQLALALADFAACLRPGGLALIQNRNFDSVLARQERWMEPQSHHEGEREWVFLRFYDYEASGLITFNILTLTREGQGGWQQSVTSTQLFPLRHDLLVGALAVAGFESIQAFGSMNGEPFDPAAIGNLIVTARKH
jgi:SAM-dependent methyltransferase